MKDQIINMIEEEDKKNPFTDEEIAIALDIFRENVTTIRKENDIPDSRERKKQVIHDDIKSILREKGNVSDRGLTKLLNDKGYIIGKYAVGKLKEEVLKSLDISVDTKDNREESNELQETEEIMIENSMEIKQDEIFSAFIGYNGSMKNQISRACAAILYPPNGLHSLIYGPSGVGKSFLAELMYQFAITTDNFEKDAPFFEFNCADYADNPQLLLAQLFGYSKGAFTGATENKKGIVEQCDGGILFLDEVHRLPPEGQEILFYLMDKGKFRRLGEADTQRKSKVMIIAATTENPQSSLLLTFRRRIPMVIEIPPMKARPVAEKIQFIHQFFYMESRRLGKEISVKEDVLKCLAGNEYSGNVGQLKSDIQVCCAKAFLERKMRQAGEIIVSFDCMSEAIKKDYKKENVSKEINTKIHGDMYFSPQENEGYLKVDLNEDWDIYEKLEIKYEQLKKEGAVESDIEALLYEEIESNLQLHIKEIVDSDFSMDEIANIVGEDILNITKDIYELAKKKIPLLESTLIFPLAIHLNMAIERMKMKGKTIRPGMKNIREMYLEEYQIAKEILFTIKKKYYFELNDEEIGFLAMYFKKFQKQNYISKGKIGVLVVSHGHVACGMAEVANKIMGVDHAVGLETDFKDSPADMADKVIQSVRQIDQGSGCIILADMGSLMNIKDQVEEETGIKVGIVGRCDTLMVIECIRKVLWTEEDIQTIIKDLDVKNTVSISTRRIEHRKEKAIVCLCITGEGAAKSVKTHLINRLSSSLDSVQIIAKGYIENIKVENIISALEESYEILAIVGTIDPQIEKYPFISISHIYRPQGIAGLRKILNKQTIFDKVNLGDVLYEKNIFINPAFYYKDEILDYTIQKMIEDGNVKPEFLLSVYKREGIMTTYLKGGIAIPHGNTELVTKPVISLTKLAKPVVWDGINTVDVIFVLALNENSKKYFEQLYKIISDEDLILAIRNSNSINEILKILHIHTESVR
ncbi:sigma 54 modulation protein [Mobilisporobacter senegalensis]|uniref:Sigma 54 modulation protein n=1 Tax=Mobilisporobacter senegalensis TaxID=1329262 RepID=A0A3N1XMJ5_9FIRM|nr:sigma 54-interacting transcriptional regulator [Mobilisporobacter senegalensis]ROR27361.1 sigma 54 modulation protein [Mobilisporobacter senegalensis]